MEGLGSAAPVGPTTLAPPAGLTFSYTPADIQGLAEPRNGGSGGIQMAGQPPHHQQQQQQLTPGSAQAQGSHLVQAQRQSMPQQQVQPPNASPRMLSGISSGISMPSGARAITSLPGSHTVNPYDTIEALIQQQERSHSQSQQSPAAVMRLPSTPDSPTKEHPRVKGRMTPYAFFVQQRRDFYRQQGVPVQFTPFSKECSALWKGMTDEEKTKYQKMAEDDRERYRREVSGFDKPLAKDGTRRGRRKKEPGQPKRNMCAFLHFCSVKRPKLKQENPSLSVGAMARQLSSAWKLMTLEQKQPYDEMAQRDKQRYEQQKQAYEAGYSAAFLRRDISPTATGVHQHSMAGGTSGAGTSAGIIPLNQVITPRHRRRKKDPDMPRRNMSAFMFFSLERRPEVKAENPEYGVGKLAQCLAERWKNMDASEKDQYEQMARKDKERYEQELKAFKRGMYKGTGLTARQVAHSVSGRTIPPPATPHNHRTSVSLTSPPPGVSMGSSGETTPTIAAATGLVIVGDSPNPLVSDEEEGTPSGDEFDHICEFYQ